MTAQRATGSGIAEFSSLPLLLALLLTLLLPAHLGGCTVAQLQKDVQAGAARVHDKQETLSAREARRDEVLAQSRDLDASLAQDQLSLAELQTVLDRLKQDNARAAQGRQRQSATHLAVQQQLQQTQAELDALHRDVPRQTGATQSGDPRIREAQAKQARLQQKLRQLLELMRKAG